MQLVRVWFDPEARLSELPKPGLPPAVFYLSEQGMEEPNDSGQTERKDPADP